MTVELVESDVVEVGDGLEKVVQEVSGATFTVDIQVK